MILNEEILKKLNKQLNDIELEKELDELSSSALEKEELRKVYESLRKLDVYNVSISESYKNDLLFRVNKKINKQKILVKLNRVSLAGYFTIMILFIVLSYHNFFYSKYDNKNFKLSLKDVEYLNNLSISDIKNTFIDNDYIEPQKKIQNKNRNVSEKDDELIAIAETNKYLLHQNYIPAVDDILLYECVDDDMLNNIFTNL
jgi:hypothetical protein